MAKRRIGILTGGGDVQPLNAVIAAVQNACRKAGIDLVGFSHGWQGVLDSSHVQLLKKKIDPAIGGTILRSSRVNLATVPDGPQRALNTLAELHVQGLIVVGGEDTLSNAFHLKDFPQVLISKTIDNDVGKFEFTAGGGKRPSIVNYFTLGHPTAARKISAMVSLKEGLRTTAYSHERIIVVESMGMHAGWLALSSCMGNPDFILIPEFPVNYAHFAERVAEKYRSQRHVIAVVAEGCRWDDGRYISADDSEKDEFGHPRFIGAADVLAKKLKSDLKGQFDTRNINAVNPSYYYRSGSPCALDASAAAKLGTKAVSLLSRGVHGATLAVLAKAGDGFKAAEYPLDGVNGIDALHRFVGEELYSRTAYSATDTARKYLSPVVPEFKRVQYII